MRKISEMLFKRSFPAAHRRFCAFEVPVRKILKIDFGRQF